MSLLLHGGPSRSVCLLRGAAINRQNRYGEFRRGGFGMGGVFFFFLKKKFFGVNFLNFGFQKYTPK
jgi:hypothetical protein